MYSYSVYGLGVQSEIPLPELNVAKVQQDVIIQMITPENIHLPETFDKPYLKINSNEAILAIENIGTFMIREGREININPSPHVDQCLLRGFIIGTVMALLLYQRGLLVLHASSININGSAVAFLGNPGSGKSSIVAALHKNGHDIISDDVSAIDVNNAAIKVLPGFSQIKLSDEVARPLGYNLNSAIPLGEQESKRGYKVNNNRKIDTPIELKQIYILKTTTDLSVGRITQQEGVKEIIRNSYPTRFAQPANPEHFLKCVDLANKIPFFHLNRSSSLDALPKLVRLVEENMS